MSNTYYGIEKIAGFYEDKSKWRAPEFVIPAGAGLAGLNVLNLKRAMNESKFMKKGFDKLLNKGVKISAGAGIAAGLLLMGAGIKKQLSKK